MRILDFTRCHGGEVTRFGSAGFGILPLGGSAHVVVATLEAGGMIGRHPTVADQLLTVISGSARVAGGDGCWATVDRGWSVLWEAGEEHEARSEDGLVALIVEGDGLASAITT